MHGSLCEKPGSERGIDVAILEAGSGKTDGEHSSALFSILQAFWRDDVLGCCLER